MLREGVTGEEVARLGCEKYKAGIREKVETDWKAKGLSGRRDKKPLLFVTASLLMCGLLWFFVSAWNRQDRDYALTEAVSRRDIRKARQLLEAGANPNARWSGYSWRDRLDGLLHRTDRADNCTVVWWARQVHDDAAMVRLLTEYGATK